MKAFKKKKKNTIDLGFQVELFQQKKRFFLTGFVYQKMCYDDRN